MTPAVPMRSERSLQRWPRQPTMSKPRRLRSSWSRGLLKNPRELRHGFARSAKLCRHPGLSNRHKLHADRSAVVQEITSFGTRGILQCPKEGQVRRPRDLIAPSTLQGARSGANQKARLRAGRMQEQTKGKYWTGKQTSKNG